MLSIGDFSKETKLTIRALRYYEEKNILEPTKVDVNTGYRYYNESQVDDAKVIVILKEVGFSIRDIQDILVNSADHIYLLEQLIMRKTRAVSELNEARYRLNLIIGIIENYQESEDDLLEVLKMDLLDKGLNEYQKSFFEMANEMTYQAGINEEDMFGLVIDIDSFKKINDIFGRAIGDVVLTEIQNAITGVPSDLGCEFVVERHGGDEFRILVKGDLETTSELASKISQRIREIDYKLYVDGLTTTATIGIAKNIYGRGAGHLFHAATTAMCDGKDRGGNNITFYDK